MYFGVRFCYTILLFMFRGKKCLPTEKSKSKKSRVIALWIEQILRKRFEFGITEKSVILYCCILQNNFVSWSYCETSLRVFTWNSVFFLSYKRKLYKTLFNFLVHCFKGTVPFTWPCYEILCLHIVSRYMEHISELCYFPLPYPAVGVIWTNPVGKGRAVWRQATKHAQRRGCVIGAAMEIRVTLLRICSQGYLNLTFRCYSHD